jgi:transposase-like protein
MEFNYHPAYGLPDEFRSRVVEYSYETSVHEAAKAFNLAVSTIYRWRADAN